MNIELYLYEPFDGLPWYDRIVLLRGHLTFLRQGAEQGILVPLTALHHAEDLARSLEGTEWVP